MGIGWRDNRVPGLTEAIGFPKARPRRGEEHNNGTAAAPGATPGRTQQQHHGGAQGTDPKGQRGAPALTKCSQKEA